MKRRYFVHFEITPNCMKAGMGGNGDVFDNLARKLRENPNVRQMLQQILDGQTEKVCVGVGREYEN
jgi:hypothetical protein